MTNVGATLRAVEPVHGGPDVHGRCTANELAGDDRLHGAEEEAEDPLVRDPLAGVLRVGGVHGGIGSALLDGLCRGCSGAIKMAMKAGTGEGGYGEPRPQHEVVGVEANGDARRCGEADGGGGVGDGDDRP
jgi:hypothetical protein